MNLQMLGDISKPLPIFMSDASAPSSGKTGLTPLVRLSKNGGVFAPAVGTVTELEGGNYVFHPDALDVNTLGPLVVRSTAVGAVDFNARYTVVAFNPFAVADLGLSAIAALAVGVNVTSLGGSTPALAALRALGLSVHMGVVSNDTVPSVSGFSANTVGSPGLKFTSNFYSAPAPGQLLVMWSGNAASKTTHVTSHTVTGNVAAFGFTSQLPIVPAVGDTFALLSL